MMISALNLSQIRCNGRSGQRIVTQALNRSNQSLQSNLGDRHEQRSSHHLESSR